MNYNMSNKPKTNGDYIRSMSDEQLAEILVNTACDNCKNVIVCYVKRKSYSG